MFLCWCLANITASHTSLFKALYGVGCFFESPSDMKLGDPSVTETTDENGSSTADNASTTAENAASPSLKTPEADSVAPDPAAESV
jgi:hypothetical protein